MIPIYKPFFPPESLKYAHDAIDSTWVSSSGKYIKLATQMLQKLTGTRFVLLVNNGTSATHLVAKCLTYKYPEIERILVPNNVYVAAWNAFLFDKQFNLIVAGVNEHTWNVDWKSVDKIIDKVDAILVVHNVNSVVNVPRVIKDYNLQVVEDNCEGFGGKYNKFPAGSKSLCASISLYANKNVTCFPAGTKIYTYVDNPKKEESRVKNIEDIKVGDLVLSRNHDGNKEYDEVVDIMENTSATLYKIYFDNHNELELTPNHEVYIHNKGWVRADTLECGDTAIQLLYKGLSLRMINKSHTGKKYEDFLSANVALNKKQKHSEILTLLHKNIRSGYRNPRSAYVKRIVRKRERESGWKKYRQTEEFEENRRRKLSEASIRNWKNDTYRMKVIKAVNKARNTPEYIKSYCNGLNVKKNKLEEKVESILFDLGLRDFKFNGDGSLGINILGSPPDFVNVKQKKLIFVNGCYWHCCHQCGFTKNITKGLSANKIHKKDIKILSECRKLGYKVLIIWEHEIENISLLKRRILDFHYNPKTKTVKIVRVEKIHLETPIQVYNLRTRKNHNYFAHGILVHNCGEGGAFVTNDEELFEYAKLLQGQGQSETKYIHSALGYNYRMTNIQAAILCGQLELYDEIMSNKERIFNRYTNELSDTENIKLQQTEDGTVPSRWMFAARIIGSTTRRYCTANEFFLKNGIETRPFFYPINTHKHLKMYQDDKMSQILQDEVVLFPSYPTLSTDEVDYISETIKRFAKLVE